MEFVGKNDGKRQNVIIYLCVLMYTVAYFGRYSFNPNINLIMEDFGVTRADAGLVNTFFFISYGIGQVVHGFLCKYYNKRLIIPGVLFVSAVTNILFCVIREFSVLKFLWMANGIAQSALWPSLILLLSQNLDSAHMKKAIVGISATTPLGTFLSYGAGAVFAGEKIHDYRYSFILGAVCLVAVAVVWFITFSKNDVSEMHGGLIAEVTDYSAFDKKNSDACKQKTKKSKMPSYLAVMVVLLGAFAVVDNFIKDGLQTWVPTILKDTYGMRDDMSLLLTLILPILGFFGSAFAIFAQKRINNFVILSSVIFGVASAFIGCILAFADVSFVPVLILFGLIVFLMYAVNNIVTSMFPLYMRDKVDSGLLAGIFDGCCYVGSAISSYGIGLVADGSSGDWSIVFILLLSAAAVCVVIGIIYVFLNKTKKEKKRLQ